MGVGLGIMIGAGLYALVQKINDLKDRNDRLENENNELRNDLNRENHNRRI